MREELAEQRRALLQMEEMAARYGCDISHPARTAREAPRRAPGLAAGRQTAAHVRGPESECRTAPRGGNLAEQRRALLQMEEMAARYGCDISHPARTAREAVQCRRRVASSASPRSRAGCRSANCSSRSRTRKRMPYRRALLQMEEMAARYGCDISHPARTAREAVQWLYFRRAPGLAAGRQTAAHVRGPESECRTAPRGGNRR
jgi:pyruvate-formate lyase